jgi:uncharacterized protein YndB with AHSA1/START domain
MAELTVTRDFDAPRELVWEAWTNPEQMTKWWGPKGVSTPLDSIVSDLRPGGKTSFVMVNDANGDRYPNSGTFVEVDPPNRLSWEDDGFEDGSGKGTGTLTLEDLGDGRTRLTVHMVADFSDTMLAGAQEGWGSSFDKLAELLAA